MTEDGDSRLLKCVGGLHDGRIVRVRCSEKITQIADRGPPPTFRILPPPTVTITYSTYSVRKLCFGAPERIKDHFDRIKWQHDNAFEFLAPLDWDDERAIRFQFGK